MGAPCGAPVWPLPSIRSGYTGVAAEEVAQVRARPVALRRRGRLLGVGAAAPAAETALTVVVVPDRLVRGVREIALGAAVLADTAAGSAVGRRDLPVVTACAHLTRRCGRVHLAHSDTRLRVWVSHAAPRVEDPPGPPALALRSEEGTGKTPGPGDTAAYDGGCRLA